MFIQKKILKFLFIVLLLFFYSCNNNSESPKITIRVEANTFQEEITDFSSDEITTYTLPNGTKYVKITPLIETGKVEMKFRNEIWKTVEINQPVEYTISNENDNILNIKVISGSNAEIYKLNLEKSRHNTNLSNIEIPNVFFTPSFSNDKLEYYALVSYDINNIEITPVLENKNATTEVKIYNSEDNSFWRGAINKNTYNLELYSGNNKLEIKVLAEDKVTTKTYIINLTRGKSDNSNLNGLEISDININPAFSKDTANYSATISNQIQSIKIKPTLEYNKSKIYIKVNSGNFNEINSGEFSDINLSNIENKIEVKVLAEDEIKSKIYTINITKKEILSNNAKLSNIIMSKGTLEPSFSSNTKNYSVNVENNINSIQLKAFSNEGGSDLKIRKYLGNWQNINSAEFSESLELNEGLNSFDIQVTAPDRTTSLIYNIKVNREKADTPSPIDIPIRSNEYTGNGDMVFHVDNGTETNFSYNLNLGNNTGDVYFIFTNTDTENDATLKVEFDNPNEIYNNNSNTIYKSKKVINSNNDILAGHPDVIEFKKNNPLSNLKKLSSASSVTFKSQLMKNVSSVGETQKFYYASGEDKTVNATCRMVVPDIDTNYGKKTLNIWVANDCWHTGGSKTKLITQNMVNIMADKFLKSGLNNDIYDWVSGIFGQEWGEHNFPTYFIQPNNEITILLYDINNDNSIGGGVGGFFFYKDNYTKNRHHYSNEKIMFYVDAVMYANEEGDSWDVSDEWPKKMLSVLAHEFQHMINYYEKCILKTLRFTDTWLDEMCSLVAQDFVADKMEVDDEPRGVKASDPTAGSPKNTKGRLPRYNYKNYLSVIDWNNNTYNYATVYAFGAYLARNFGGAELFKKIMQNQFSDYQAVKEACGVSSFGELLQRWGVANLLSDNIDPTQSEYLKTKHYQYNKGDWFNSNLNNINYRLGSINLYNYYYYFDGPKVFNPEEDISLSKASNKYYLTKKSATGTIKTNINFQGNNKLKLTVVVKALD